GQGITGAINGGGGTNTLTYALYNTPVTVNLAAGTATGIGGGFSNITKLIGGTSGANTLIGPNATNTWTLNAVNGGIVSGVTFTTFQNLTGGTGKDLFVFSAGKSVSGAINGGGGVDWLDYALYTTAVTVNLATGTATGVGGGISGIRHVRGG